MNVITGLSLLLSEETKDVETTVQDGSGAPVVVAWRLRRVSSASVGAILAPAPPDPAAPAPEQADPLESTRRALAVVCASVVAVRMPGQSWSPITLTMGGEPDDASSIIPISRLGMARIRALSEAVAAMTMEGGDVLARFLDRGVATP